MTAGPTRAFVDDVRYLTNASSGRMAAALAAATLACGHALTIVSGPVQLAYPKGARVIPLVTTGEMLAASLAKLPCCDGVIATLARKSARRQWFVAFALEPGADPERAFEKIEAKRCDLIVVNDLTAMEGTETAVTVYDRRHEAVGNRSGAKRAVAGWLIRLFEARLVMPS